MARTFYRRYFPRPPVLAILCTGLLWMSVMAVGIALYHSTTNAYDYFAAARQVSWFAIVVMWALMIEWLFKLTMWVTYVWRRLSRKARRQKRRRVREEDDE